MDRKYTEEELEIKREKEWEDYLDSLIDEIDFNTNGIELEERRRDEQWIMRSLGIY